MKIALLAPLRYPIAAPFHGGLEMHSWLLARELESRGHQVTLFAHPDSDRAFDIQPVAIPGNAGFSAQLFAYRKAIARLKTGDFDAIHNNSIHFLPPLLAGGFRIPMITTLHTPPYRSLRLGGSLVRASNHSFVSISQHLHDVWSPFVGEHPVIHNGIDVRQWTFNPTPEPDTAVWYGRFTPEKGAEYAIKAAKKAGFQITLAGPIYDQEYFNKTVKPLLGGATTYAGHLALPELADLVGRSAVGLVTSVWDEPFGLVYLEMPACGTPVAAFDSGATREIISPATGSIVAKKDIEALTQVLGELQSKDRAAARQAIINHFGMNKMAARYEELYAR